MSENKKTFVSEAKAKFEEMIQRNKETLKNSEKEIKKLEIDRFEKFKEINKIDNLAKKNKEIANNEKVETKKSEEVDQEKLVEALKQVIENKKVEDLQPEVQKIEDQKKEQRSTESNEKIEVDSNEPCDFQAAKDSLEKKITISYFKDIRFKKQNPFVIDKPDNKNQPEK